LIPLVGVRSFNLPGISEADYIELVDFTGRELHQVSKEISQRPLRWYWLRANFEKDFGRQYRIILPRLRLGVLGLGLF